MKKKIVKLLIGFVILLVISIFQSFATPQQSTKSPKTSEKNSENKAVLGQQTDSAVVTRVVDGDTIEVNGKEKIRIIGINTPETVDPRKKVECFGKEASQRAKELLTNQSVKLENDPSQANVDRYGRLLRYVFLLDGTDFGLKMIKEGYAYEYTYDTPYKYQKVYKAAQKDAENGKVGLWGKEGCTSLFLGDPSGIVGRISAS